MILVFLAGSLLLLTAALLWRARRTSDVVSRGWLAEYTRRRGKAGHEDASR